LRGTPRLPVIEGDVGASLDQAAKTFRDEIVSLASRIAAIPAPTNDETRRTEFVAKAMPEMGFQQVEVDELGDVVGLVPGRGIGPKVLIAAHLDTVFPLETELTIRQEHERLHGPGIGDNSLGIAAAMFLPKLLASAGVEPAVDLLVTGNVGEEGLGNLRGMKAVMDRYSDIGAVIAIEGHNLGRVTHVAVGSRRYRVDVTGPGGHSWGDFGNENAIHSAAEIIGDLVRIPLPNSPKTTLNVGTVQGGISVNTIAPDTSFLLDLRSVDETALQSIADEVERILTISRDGIEVKFTLLGVRPAGTVSPGSPIVRLAGAILESIGIQPTGDASSTDANIPINKGIPALCIGLTTGGNVHKEDEFIDIPPVRHGVYQLLALTIAVGDGVFSGSL
jgi:tripeptide aminopeptidase